MTKTLLLSITICFVTVFTAMQAAAASADQQVTRCLKSGDCALVVVGPASSEPKLTLLVLEKAWKKFGEIDMAELRETLKERVYKAREKPDKFASVSKKSPAYDAVIRSLKNMKAYAVSVCYARDREGRLLPGREVLAGYRD